MEWNKRVELDLSIQLVTFSEFRVSDQGMCRAGDYIVMESYKLQCGTRALHETLLKLVPTDKYLSAQKSLFQNKCWNIAVVQVNNALDVGREKAFAGLTVEISKNLTCRNEIQRSGSFSKVYFNATYYQNVSSQYLLQINNYAGG